MKLSEQIALYLPLLNKKLKMAEISKRPEEFIEELLNHSLVQLIIITAVFAILFWYFNIPLQFLLFLPLLYPLLFFYNLLKLDVYLIKKRKAIEYNLVFAIKHLVVTLSSGTPLFDALVGITKGYGAVSDEIRKVVEDVTLGEPLTSALRKRAELTPSPAFKSFLIQIANAVVSGANVADALDAVAEQIAKEEIMAAKRYGQTLNPIIMAYLIMTIIFPTLIIAFLLILLTFVGKGIKIGFIHMLFFTLFIALMQYLFLAFVESSRPKYAILE
jgi:pilus assembly protein TadC